MKILFVNHFPLTGSGSGVYTINLAKSLTSRGHECAVVFPENRINYENFDGIKLYPVFFMGEEVIEDDYQLDFNFPCFSTHPRSSYNFLDMNRFQRNEYQEAFYKAIGDAIYDFKPDIIHGQHLWTLSGICSSLGEIYKVPLIVTCHGTDIIGMNQEKEKGLDWGTIWAEEAYDYASSIITISEDNKKLLEEKFGQDDRVKLIRNGIDTNMFYKDNNLTREEVLKEFDINNNYDNVICFVGKLTEIKGVDTLLDALSNINNNKNILTLIAGDGELRKSLEKYAKKLNLDSVIFLGNLPQEKLQKIYNIADCSIVPSRSEAFGLVAAESIACGSPVISTNVGGLPDIINTSNGILFDVDDSLSLASNLIKVLLGEIKFDREKIAQDIKDKYSQDNIISEIEELYEEAIKNIEKNK